ncbi:hypothetical protein C804_04119 [Lachnospiraceae bacterium A4]|nr:hypothetical protein C804_04119 [Lachnospiraceae bacterium A4]
MVKIMSYEDNFFDLYKTFQYQTVIYGAGVCAKRALLYLNMVTFICDRKANEINEINGISVVTPAMLETIKEKFFIVLCIKSSQIRKEIKNELKKLSIDALIFDYFDNIAFDIYIEKELINHEKRKLYYICLICEDEGWILRKFALKMKEQLDKQGYKCSIQNVADPLADINHHVIYASCNPVISYNETFMITHIDSFNKLEFIKHQVKKVLMAICMSRETMEKLASYGVPREKLCYINPAQDGVIEPKKYILGIMHRTYNDHRKNEDILIDICKALDADYFVFKIMGSGWDHIVNVLRTMGFEVEYYNEFNYDTYTELIPSLDYYLFWGFDEGSMGYLDALRAGVETIVTPQGFHLDLKDGITYACRTIADFKKVLLMLQDKRKKIVQSVENWTWKNYVDKHLEVWNYLLGIEDDIYKNQHMYEDGIFSVLRLNV